MSLEPAAQRRRRVGRLDPTVTTETFALRDAIVADPDAEVRRTALLRLDDTAARRLLAYSRDATRDPSMRVREAAFVALARARDAESLSRAAEACRHDRGFRVRRAAVVYAARTFGATAAPAIELAVRDPFWRVRVAAERCARVLGASSTVRSGALEAPTATEIAGLDDPDPAVVAARLGRRCRDVEPILLVPLLGHSHQALRRIALKEIGTRGDATALRAATRWLIDERVPYGPSAAEAALARADARATTLARAMVREMDLERPGPLAWAIRADVDGPAWAQLLALVAHEDVRVRRAALARVPEVAPDRAALLDVMCSLLGDEDEVTRSGAATWLAQTRSREARRALLALDLDGQPTEIREIAVELLAGSREFDRLRQLSHDDHVAVRSCAVSRLLEHGALSEFERRSLERDPDPWIRRAVLVSHRASTALLDPSPIVRTGAVEALDGDALAAWAQAAALHGESDAAMRARAAVVLREHPTPPATRALLRLSRDQDFGVRSAAIAALRRRQEQIGELLGAESLNVGERIAAHTLLRLHGEPARTWTESDPRVLAHLALLDDVLAGRVPPATHMDPRAPSGPTDHRRRLGKTGLLVHPFGLSGAHDLSFDDFTLAQTRGVNLFFWEPSHRELGRFLRSRSAADAVVVAGTYEAGAASVERDVVRALRTLKRDAIDVFLAFWTRSAARLDEVQGAFEHLVGRGLVRSTGVSTHHRELACQAADRGFDVVMVRHSAAHRGAESTVFPHCSFRNTGVITFSNLCYGRMLHRSPIALSASVTAPDCYRYSISQPGVGACIAAPRRHSELIENLATTDEPFLARERELELQAHGEWVYAQSKAWSASTWARASGSEADSPESRSELDDWVAGAESISWEMW